MVSFLSPSVVLTKAAFLCSHTDKHHARHFLANEKFGVIFILHAILYHFRCKLWLLPVRACHESPWLHFGIRNSSPPAFWSSDRLVWLWLWEPVRRSCVPGHSDGRGTITLVQYAAYLSPSTVSKEMLGDQGYNSILITLVRMALHFFFLGKLHRSPDGIPEKIKNTTD